VLIRDVQDGQPIEPLGQCGMRHIERLDGLGLRAAAEPGGAFVFGNVDGHRQKIPRRGRPRPLRAAVRSEPTGISGILRPVFRGNATPKPEAAAK
jgi:hypothetical protein